MRVNISNNKVVSIDFETVDQVIDFIEKFNNMCTELKETYQPSVRTTPIMYDPKPYIDWVYKVGDTIPNPYTVTSSTNEQ